MKSTPLLAAALGLACLAAPAFAEDTAAVPATTPAAAFTVDTPIAALMADERAKAVLDKHLPGIDQHPAYEQFKAMSLKALAPFSQGMISDDMLAAIEADLATIK
ncbi:hypothetical protein OIK40_03695 [Erythrobacter sp. sf7]|uniref:Uncharacterized protein n=1 Tax=Erythrobacter fulvus TaxID=2987523 RepID=A0ABT5JLV5_9SPHN|nr:hypothetical protein [Erythrobacter fulvus]MDC8753742.1 hypothetical protein [Erythrobacter fulvus]